MAPETQPPVPTDGTTSGHLPVLWLVVPCFNEEAVLPETTRRLREKIENVSSQWALKTVWGVGYKFELAGAPGAKES